MTVDLLILELEAKNIRIRADGDQLTLVGAEEELEPALLDQIRKHKGAILEIMKDKRLSFNGRSPHLTPTMFPLVTLTQSELDRIVDRVPGGATNIQDIYPLAPLQEGILFHHLLGNKGDPYLLAQLLRFDSRERLDKYLEALQWVVDRHDVLRSGIAWEGLSEPVQIVWRTTVLPVQEITLGTSTDHAEDLYRRFDPRHYRIDLFNPPLMQIHFAEDKATHSWLAVLLLHHLTGDHNTLEAIQDEIRAFHNGQARELPSSDAFRSLALHAKSASAIKEHKDYFTRLLQDLREPTAPFGIAGAFEDGTSSREALINLEDDLSRRLRNQARRIRVSSATICHVAWACVVARTSRRDEAVFGTVLLGRMQGGSGSESALGMFINTLPFRIPVESQSVEEAVRVAQRILADLLEHEHASLALAQGCSGIPAPTPLFTSLFNYRHARRSRDRKIQALEGVVLLKSEERTNYPITLSVNDFGDTFSLAAQTTDTIDPSRVCRFMQTAIEVLVDALEKTPQKQIGALDVLPLDERTTLLSEWNHNRKLPRAEQYVHRLFEDQVLRTPDAVALSQGSRNITFAELNRRANQLARHLQELGVGRHTRVAICLERSFELVESLIGVLKAGAAYVPLDPILPEERLRFMLRDAKPTVLLGSSNQEQRKGFFDEGMVLVDALDRRAWSHLPDSNLDAVSDPVNAADPAYVIYTSGSTGSPKGSEIPHRSIPGFIFGVDYARFDETTVFLQHSSLSWDALTLELWPTLLRGGRCVLAQHRVLTPSDLTGHVASGVNTIWLTAALLHSIVDTDVACLEGIRQLLTGGEQVSVKHVHRLIERHPQIRVVNGYGPSECTVFCTCFVVPPNLSKDLATLPIGMPIGDRTVYVLDSHQRLAPVDVVGELYVAGDSLALGYLNQPELTDERFVGSPLEDRRGERLYRTGDLVRWKGDGNLEFVGRTDQQVKVRGFRIELGDIEAHLKTFQFLRDAVVIAAQHPSGEKQLVAYYTTDDGELANGQTIRAYLLARVPEYMVPAAYVRVDQIPLTSTGKLDRKALPAPSANAYDREGYQAPIGEVEEILASIWADLLGIEQIGRNDNFFALGGHSLLAVRMIGLLKQMNFSVDLRALFSQPTVAGLAATVRSSHTLTAVPANLIPATCDAIVPSMIPLLSLTQQEIDLIADRVPGGVSNIQDIYPLAPLQEGILFHHLMAGDGDPYLLAELMRFDTRQRMDRYLEALQWVINRHDVLRTGIVWEGLTEPVQVVWRIATLPIVHASLPSGFDPAEALYQAYNPRSFRIGVSDAPLLRAYVARDKDDGKWLLMLLLHHLVGDHSAMEVLQDEIAAYLQGRGNALAAPEPFRNLVAHARAGRSRDEHEVFFRKELQDVIEPTAPFGIIDANGDGTVVTEAVLKTDPRLTIKLRELARTFRVTTATLCHLAWACVVARTSGRDEAIFGTVLFGRSQGGTRSDRTIGMFINTLPLRVRIGDETVEATIESLQESLANLILYEHASLALVQRCSGIPSPMPLFTSLFNYRHIRRVSQSTEETVKLWDGIDWLKAEERTNYPLTFSVNDFGEEISLTAQTVSPIDPMRVCRYMEKAIESLLHVLETAPGSPISDIDVVPAEERSLLLYTWNSSTNIRIDDRCIHELFEEQVLRTPNAVALSQAGQEVTYSELNSRANRLARSLRAQGVGADIPVGVYLPRSFDMVTAILGILKAGGAYVPLDLRHPPNRLAYMLTDAGVDVLITATRECDLAFAYSGALVYLDCDRGADDGIGSENLSVPISPDNLACIIYTSGSTGHPKGSEIPHRSIPGFIFGAEYARFDQSTVFLQHSSVSWDALSLELWPALFKGGRCELAENTILTPMDLRNSIRRGVNTVWLTSALFQSLVDSDIDSMEGIETLLTGGERVSVAHVRRTRDRFPGMKIVNGYGPSECTVFSSCYCVPPDLSAPIHSLPIGKPIGDRRIYVLDAHGRVAPVGVRGELYIGGPAVARGYRNQQELTKSKFVKDPFSSGDEPMYRTGDLGRWRADGNLEFEGREDHQVKIRGFRIEPSEIDAQLASHPAIREAVTISGALNSGDRQLIAYYTLADSIRATGDELKTYLSSFLPDYMIPACFVPLERLPLLPNGKVDRNALPLPDMAQSRRGDHESPLGPVERLLAEIWEELLGVRNVGRHDNFFALGGHSLLAVRMIGSVNKHGLGIDMRALYDRPTLAGLASVVSSSPSDTAVHDRIGIPANCAKITPEMITLASLTQEEIDSIVSSVPGGSPNIQDIYPLTALQEGMLFHHLIGPGADPYLLRSLGQCEDRDSLDRYLAALQRVIERHDILRTAVVWQGIREPVQVVWRKATLPIEEVDLGQTEDAVNRLYDRFQSDNYRMDLSRAPLLRVCIAQTLPGGKWIFVLLLHHLVGDHSTMEVLQDEVAAYLRGDGNELSTPEPFRNLVVQSRRGISNDDHETYFRTQLGDVTEPTAPFGVLDVHGDGTVITETTLSIPAELTAKLRDHARRLRVSSATLCHLAWACVVAKTSGRDEAIFGTVLFGRMKGGPGFDRMMGVFINTLPVRIRLDNSTVDEATRSVHKLLADLVRHEHAPLALVQRYSSIPAPIPVFTSLFNYRHIRPLIQREEASLQSSDGVEWLKGDERTNYPLTLSVNDFGDKISLTCQAVTSIDPDRICRFMETALESLTDALENTPDAIPIDLAVIPPEESTQLLHEWNHTYRNYSRDKCIHELIEEQVMRTPDSVALSDGNREITYIELNRRANQLALHLRSVGVGPDQLVGIYLARSADMLIAMLAILKAGGAYVPLDPDYPVERLRFIVRDAQLAIVISHTVSKEQVHHLDPALTVLGVEQHGADESARSHDIWRSSIGLTPSHLAYVIYTSGSTGTPKGVMVEHANTVNFIYWARETFADALQRTLFSTSLNFDLAVFECFVPLSVGATVVIVESVLDMVDMTVDVTLVNTVPSAIATLLEKQGVQSSVRVVNLAGEALRTPLVTKIFDTTAVETVCNLYGPSETTTYSTYASFAVNGSHNPIHIGKPISNTAAYVLDRHQHLAPIGVSGELYIGGAGVVRGYLNRPDLTSERFLANPFSSTYAPRLYRTGDIVRWRTDGNLDFIGRADYQVKLRGFRIELGEIEQLITEQDSVQEAVVSLVETPRLGQQLVAYYTVLDGAHVEVEELKTSLESRLPRHMIPAAYVLLDEMPRTSNGKLARNMLPAPDGSSFARPVYEEPIGEVETRLALIWEELLDIERVGRSDNFFDLGGHSLLAVRLMERMRRVGFHALLHEIFSSRTLESLAALVRESHPVADMPIELRAGSPKTPLFFTHEGANEVSYAWALSPYVTTDIPLYALPAQPAGQERLRTIEGAAQRMVDLLRTIQPYGPYRLCGYSFGAILAYEVAAQLLGADEEVEMLALLDLHLFGTEDMQPLLRPKACPETIEQFVSVLRGHFSRMGIEHDQRLHLLRRAEALEDINVDPEGFDNFIEDCRQESLLPETWLHATGRQITNMLAHQIDQLHAPYFYATLPLEVDLFIAQDDPLAGDSADRFRRHLPKIQLHETYVPGTHWSMLQEPHIRSLGDKLSTGLSRSHNRRDYVPAFAAVVPLSVSRLLTTRDIPLFCVPGAAQDAESVRGLASCPDYQSVIYGFRPRGLDAGTLPHSTIESAAAFYVKELEQVYPTGPLSLLGHLEGAWVAFEMALILESLGREVCLVTVLSAEAPQADEFARREYTQNDVVQYCSEMAALKTGKRDVSIRDLETLSPSEQRQALQSLLKSAGYLRHDSDGLALPRLLRTLGARLRAVYKPRRRYAGKLLCVTSVNKSNRYDPNMDSLPADVSGWSMWADRVVCHYCPGTPVTMLHPPHVEHLLALLQSTIHPSIDPQLTK